jgi:hypothetical protein
MKSNWEYTKSRSNYHFDDFRHDSPGDRFRILGRYPVTWQQELEHIKSRTRPMTWRNRKSTVATARPASLSPHIAQEEYDIAQGGGDPDMELTDVFDDLDSVPNIKNLSAQYALDQEKTRVHVQRTGQVFNQHIDKLDMVYPNADPADIVKLVVMLEDWRPGQFYIYGTCTYTHWCAGDVHWFDWFNTPHATANASHYPRYSVNIMGLRTSKTNLEIFRKD